MDNNICSIDKLNFEEYDSYKLVELVDDDIECLSIVREILKSRNSILPLKTLNTKYPDLDLEKEEDEIIESKNPFFVKYFAQDNPWCNIKKMGQVYVELSRKYIENFTDDYDKKELNFIYMGIYEMANLDNENVKFYEDFIIEDNNLSRIADFLANVKFVNKDRFCKILCLSDNEEYKKILLQEYMLYAIKYLDLNKYIGNSSFGINHVRNSIMNYEPLNLIYYIEQNKHLFIDYKNFIDFILQEPNDDISNLLDIFNDYINNPFAYQDEDLWVLIENWNKKYVKEKTFI